MFQRKPSHCQQYYSNTYRHLEDLEHTINIDKFIVSAGNINLTRITSI
jgi:hypothetical protein